MNRVSPRSSEDRALPSGGRGTGSSPVGGTSVLHTDSIQSIIDVSISSLGWVRPQKYRFNINDRGPIDSPQRHCPQFLLHSAKPDPIYTKYIQKGLFTAAFALNGDIFVPSGTNLC